METRLVLFIPLIIINFALSSKLKVSNIEVTLKKRVSRYLNKKATDSKIFSESRLNFYTEDMIRSFVLSTAEVSRDDGRYFTLIEVICVTIRFIIMKGCTTSSAHPFTNQVVKVLLRK